MSGLERILARVNGNALRESFSLAMEDELTSIETKLQCFLETVENTREVQDAIQQVNVPLSEANIATLAVIQSEYQEYADDLGVFIHEQRQFQASERRGESPRVRTVSIASSVGDENLCGRSSQLRLAKLASKIQSRLSKKKAKHTWIFKNIQDMETVATVLKSFTPEIILNPLTKPSDLTRVHDVLKELEPLLEEFAINLRALVTSKLRPPEPAAASDASNSSNERRSKRQRVDLH